MKPTYLYIKEHSITGMRYFGKTTKTDPYKYQGSGKHWQRHIKKHGKEYVKTTWVSEPFTDESRLVEFAMLMSEELDVVKSNKWANLKEENGLDGGGDWSSMKGKKQTPEHLEKLSKVRKGRTPWNKGKSTPDEVKKKISVSEKGRSAWNKGITGIYTSTRKDTKDKIIICPHCNKTGGNSIMKRWHFNNCKLKGDNNE